MIKPRFTSASGWDMVHQANPSADLKLFCFPYAGGTAAAFRTWHKGLPRNVEVHAVQLPGRANRVGEQVPPSFAQLIEDLLSELIDALNPGFAFFGHSMGAILAYEVARTLRRYRLPLPVRLFLSGHRAPHVPRVGNAVHAASDDDLIASVRRLGGTPEDVLANPELLQLVLPTLRADFRLCETYRYRPEPPLAMPITAFGGTDDGEATREELDAWREHTTGSFRVHMIPGEHFFVHSAESTVLECLCRELNPVPPPPPAEPG